MTVKIITHVHDEMAKAVDLAVKRGYYRSRQSLIRSLIRRYLIEGENNAD